MTIDIIVIYSPILVEPKMSAKKICLLLKCILHKSKTISFLMVVSTLNTAISNHFL